MQIGFSFKGIHSSSFGITASTKSRPILPERKRLTFEPDAYDGLIDVSACNERRRMLYQERVFSIKIMVAADDIFRLQDAMTRLVSWLQGSGSLIFDDLPAVVWDASVISAIDYMPQKSGQIAELDVSFTVKPFSHAEFRSDTGAPLGSKIRLGTPIPLGLDDVLTKRIQVLNYNSLKIFSVMNIGTAPVQPLIEITDNAVTTSTTTRTKIQIQIQGGSTLRFVMPQYCTSITIDTATGQVMDKVFLKGTEPEDENLEFQAFEPFELTAQPTMYTWLFVRSSSTDITLRFIYTPRFLYDWKVN